MMVLCEETSVDRIVKQHFQNLVGSNGNTYDDKKVMQILTELRKDELTIARGRLDRIDDNDDPYRFYCLEKALIEKIFLLHIIFKESSIGSNFMTGTSDSSNGSHMEEGAENKDYRDCCVVELLIHVICNGNFILLSFGDKKVEKV